MDASGVQSLRSVDWLVPRATTASTYSGRTYGRRIPADILQLADETRSGRPPIDALHRQARPLALVLRGAAFLSLSLFFFL